VIQPEAAVPALPITRLVFKGTHNSYACFGQSTPYMGHPPRQQIDDFGVWCVELDYAIQHVDGGPRAVMGHDEADDASCWGHYLRDHIEFIHRARAHAYRPVFFIFDVKDWGDTDHDTAIAIGVDDLRAVYGPGNVVVLTDSTLAAGVPTVPDLAGKAVLSLAGMLPRGYEDECTSREAVNQAIDRGTGLEGGCPGIPGRLPPGCCLIGIDQYQADWTFEYGVPPNPLVVDIAATPPWTVGDTDPRQDRWVCDNGDTWSGQVVDEQGSWRFPYRTLTAAATRARGTTRNGAGDQRRSGYGWTVLLAPGRYPETLTIDIPLRLMRNPDMPGADPVVIG
jgi:hypothetical protein